MRTPGQKLAPGTACFVHFGDAAGFSRACVLYLCGDGGTPRHSVGYIPFHGKFYGWRGICRQPRVPQHEIGFGPGPVWRSRIVRYIIAFDFFHGVPRCL